jgi:hypothetical protein
VSVLGKPYARLNVRRSTFLLLFSKWV